MSGSLVNRRAMSDTSAPRLTLHAPCVYGHSFGVHWPGGKCLSTGCACTRFAHDTEPEPHTSPDGIHAIADTLRKPRELGAK